MPRPAASARNAVTHCWKPWASDGDEVIGAAAAPGIGVGTTVWLMPEVWHPVSSTAAPRIAIRVVIDMGLSAVSESVGENRGKAARDQGRRRRASCDGCNKPWYSSATDGSYPPRIRRAGGDARHARPVERRSSPWLS